MDGGTSLVEGDIWGKVECKGTGGEKDHFGMVEDGGGGESGEKGVWSMRGARGRGGIWFGFSGGYRIRRDGRLVRGDRGRATWEEDVGRVEEEVGIGWKEDPFVIVEDEGNGRGFGDKGKSMLV